jgi:SAM-dependent methyltransferase
LFPPHFDPSTASVLEIASGTGKFTNLLREAAAIRHLTTVEPSADFRSTFSKNFPDVPCLEGTADALPVASNTQDAIFIAQAFHWFAHRPALVECHRVLKPNGWLGLVWNIEDGRTPWVAALRSIYERFDSSIPQYRHGLWKNAFDSNPDLFTKFRHTRFENNVIVDSVETIWNAILSKSYIAVLDAKDQSALEAEVMAHLSMQTFNRSSDGHILYPYVTNVYTAFRRDDLKQ